MGYTSTRLPAGVSVKKFIDNEFRLDNTVLTGMSDGVHYAAVKNAENGTVSAYVTLIETKNGEIAWKTMSEFEGPCASRCPKKILDALTPLTENDETLWAIRWREESESFNINKKLIADIRPGATLIFTEPLDFGDRQIGEFAVCAIKGNNFYVSEFSANHSPKFQLSKKILERHMVKGTLLIELAPAEDDKSTPAAGMTP